MAATANTPVSTMNTQYFFLYGSGFSTISEGCSESRVLSSM